MKLIKTCLLLPVAVFVLSSCTSVDLYEKDVTIPGFKWKSSFKPEYTFTIKDTTSPYQLFLVLRHNEKWLGTGMDDIYEHRIKLTDPQYLKAGIYHFRIEQIMREDPLENVMNIGLRVEKK